MSRKLLPTALRLKGLNERSRLSCAWADAYYEAACCCLDRHHTPPIQVRVAYRTEEHSLRASWEIASPRSLASNANTDEATQYGAYAVCMASVEAVMDHVVWARAERFTGADWYIVPRATFASSSADDDGLPDLDSPNGRKRLEVAGQDTGEVGARLRLKIQQLRRGASSIPGVAAVVGFEKAVVRIQHLEDDAE